MNVPKAFVNLEILSRAPAASWRTNACARSVCNVGNSPATSHPLSSRNRSRAYRLQFSDLPTRVGQQTVTRSEHTWLAAFRAHAADTTQRQLTPVFGPR